MKMDYLSARSQKIPDACALRSARDSSGDRLVARVGWRQIAVPEICRAPIRGASTPFIPDISIGDSYKLLRAFGALLCEKPLAKQHGRHSLSALTH